MLLEVREISKSFGWLKAVDKCHMVVQENSITGLIGPNGAGKSTVFSLITGFLKPDKGEIIYQGTNITELPPYAIARKGLGRTFQTPQGLPRMTVLENLLLAGSTEAEERILSILFSGRKIREREKAYKAEALELLNAMGFIDKKNEYIANLSPGEARVVEVLRQLMLKPKLLCLDEPASGLNLASQRELEKFIRKLLERGLTMLIVEHNLNFIMRLSSTLYVMNRGGIIAHGVPDEVAKDDKVIEVYLGGRP